MAILDGPQLVHITTVGRRSGVQRRLEILAHPHGEGILLVGSKAGAAHHPAWYHNLVAEPRVLVEVLRGPTAVMRARITSGAERDLLFAATAARFPFFADYQRRTRRVIPVVVLEPMEGEGGQPLPFRR